MQREDFKPGQRDQLIANLDGRVTFSPPPLPPNVEFSPSLQKQAEEVANLLGRLDGYASSLPDRQILIRSFVRREAQLSSYIEDTYAEYEEVANAQEAQPRATISSPAKETANAERAILAGIEAVFEHGRPISLLLIRQMHELLLHDVRGHECRGRFRNVQVYIGASRDPDQARFVPPAPFLIDESMDQFIRFLEGKHHLSALIQIAMLHYQFESIHPFEDGNGRLGRILILLGLCQHRLLLTPMLHASIYFERNRQLYYDGLLGVSLRGDWQTWVEFFITGIREAVLESNAKLRELTTLRKAFHERVVEARGSALLMKFVDNLFIQPVITVTEAAKVMGVSYEAARVNIQKLHHMGVMSIRKAGKPTVYVADVILKAVNAEPTRR